MAEIATDEQEDADAMRVKGEVTSAPLAGLLTVGLAKAVETIATKNAGTRTAVRRDFIVRDTWIVNLILRLTPGAEPTCKAANLDRAEDRCGGCVRKDKLLTGRNDYHRNQSGPDGRSQVRY